MNTQKMLKLADVMEDLDPEKFNMSYFGNKTGQDSPVVCKEDLNLCGTTCCIAGYLLLNMGYCLTKGGSVYSDVTRTNYVGDAADMAQEELGLTDKQRNHLFYPWNWDYVYNTQDPKDAARLIRDMVAQEKVSIHYETDQLVVTLKSLAGSQKKIPISPEDQSR